MPEEEHPSVGTTLESFLRETGEWDEVDAAARERVRLWVAGGCLDGGAVPGLESHVEGAD